MDRVQQRQTWGRKASNFGWATFRWASCIIVQQGSSFGSCPTFLSQKPTCVKSGLVGGNDKYICKPTRPSDSWQNRTCRIVGFTVPANYKVKLIEKRNERWIPISCNSIKKLWYMTVTVITVVIRALDTASKGLGRKDLKIRGRMKII